MDFIAKFKKKYKKIFIWNLLSIKCGLSGLNSLKFHVFVQQIIQEGGDSILIIEVFVKFSFNEHLDGCNICYNLFNIFLDGSEIFDQKY
ncbi:hypothetical protein IKA_05702 [Bacillus cereus VD169]|nr:hypothetical protein IKA_05702 [Bacillus cereus VD169]